VAFKTKFYQQTAALFCKW